MPVRARPAHCLIYGQTGNSVDIMCAQDVIISLHLYAGNAKGSLIKYRNDEIVPNKWHRSDKIITIK